MRRNREVMSGVFASPELVQDWLKRLHGAVLTPIYLDGDDGQRKNEQAQQDVRTWLNGVAATHGLPPVPEPDCWLLTSAGEFWHWEPYDDGS